MAGLYHFNGNFVWIYNDEKDFVLTKESEHKVLLLELRKNFVKHQPNIDDSNFETKTVNGVTIIGPFSHKIAVSVTQKINQYVAKTKGCKQNDP